MVCYLWFVHCASKQQDTSTATSAMPGQQQLVIIIRIMRIIRIIPSSFLTCQFRSPCGNTNTPTPHGYKDLTPHLLVLAGILETLQKSEDLYWMVLRKDTFSTQDELIHTKAIIKELELTPGNVIMAKVELAPGSGIIPFCASQRCFSHMERQSAVPLAASHNQFLVSPEVRNTACKPVLRI